MAHALENLGCGVLCAPGVTSTTFYEELAGACGCPSSTWWRETAKELQAAGKTRAGILATTAR